MILFIGLTAGQFTFSLSHFYFLCYLTHHTCANPKSFPFIMSLFLRSPDIIYHLILTSFTGGHVNKGTLVIGHLTLKCNKNCVKRLPINLSLRTTQSICKIIKTKERRVSSKQTLRESNLHNVCPLLLSSSLQSRRK